MSDRVQPDAGRGTGACLSKAYQISSVASVGRKEHVMGECVTLSLPRSHRPGADSHGEENQTLRSSLRSRHGVEEVRRRECVRRECGMSYASSCAECQHCGAHESGDGMSTL